MNPFPLAAATILALTGTVACAEEMRMAVTTSFRNSGLADVLLPAIRGDLGLDVRMLVVGTGQAIRLGEAGDVDAILVHSPDAEEKFVEEGFGLYRRKIMYNDFVFIGPTRDPAGIGGAENAADALRLVAQVHVPFVSRGDDSGTHEKETSLWKTAGLDTEGFGSWYRSVGAGMGAALNTASAMNAYIMSDRASWLNFGNKGDLVMLYSGDPVLFNQYTYIPVDPARHPHVKNGPAIRLEKWLVSERARKLIDGYRIGGHTPFVFNAAHPDHHPTPFGDEMACAPSHLAAHICTAASHRSP